MSAGVSVGPFAGVSPGWRASSLALVLVAGGLVLACLGDAVDAVSVWWSSTAYNYCFLVLPLAVVVAAQPGRWERIKAAVPRPDPRFLALAPLVAVVWLVADRLGIGEGRQIMAVTAFQVAALCVLGLSAARAAAAPLLFLYLLVPMGEFLVPRLQAVTVSFITLGLDWTGVLYFNDGLSIDIPEGRFFVAEACAGLRFLIACVAVGVTYSLVFFRSWKRRVVFVAAAVVAPVVANGLRAFGIVYLGHLMGSAQAAVVDHLLYGYVFFSIVVVLLAAAGYPFHQPLAGPSFDGSSLPSRSPHSVSGVALISFGLFSLGPVLSYALDGRVAAVPVSLALSPMVVDGCSGPEGARFGPWRYDCDGTTVDLELSSLPGGGEPTAASRLHRAPVVEAESGSSEKGVGPWTVFDTQHPPSLSAVSFWIDGAPSPGGVRERVLLARASLVGSACSVVKLVLRVPADDPVRGRAVIDAVSGSLQREGRLQEAVRVAACGIS